MISSEITFSDWIPDKYNILLPFPPPVIPTSVIAASPGPLTTHPITDKVTGSFMCDNFSSKILTVSITLKACLAHDGQDIILTPLSLRFKDFKISLPIFTSSTGSSDNETLIVSPIPASNNLPIPIEDLMLPDTNPPASVMPKCKGYSVFSYNCSKAEIERKTSEDNTQIFRILKF